MPQPALVSLDAFERDQKSVPVLEQSGLIQSRFFDDRLFQTYSQQLMQIDCGTDATILSAGLAHWSRRWEYPFALHGVLRFLKGKGIARARVLDSACGYSPLPFVLAALGHDVIGVDLDEALPAKWREYRIPDPVGPGSATFQLGNMEAMGLPSDSFDAAYCVSSLEHTSDPRRGLAELLRTVKPGGLVLITCDTEPSGSLGISAERLDEMLTVMEGQATLWYPPRWCHPQEALTFLTRPERKQDTFFVQAARQIRESLRSVKSTNMSILGAAWVNNG
jgi:SAM-dependent methyltransferase